MKRLYLVRHAKSSWEFDLDDHERPLSERGLHDAPLVAGHINEELEFPDKILSSDAVRAKTTALFYLKVLGIEEAQLALNPKLYDFNGREVEKIIRSTANEVDCLMIFGHNNAMTHLVNKLGDLEIDNVATAAFTEIIFEQSSWAEVTKGTTKRHIKPKQLK
ncbi:SixA phosphatase family protein [Flavimarina sp. Hel_I_48]|uniref:SixA phosphatase family protein n=1 Tax=Flavimarina sp. Hel_I_48 TaxID=1392488 RepID=UPI0004DF3F42|nr:histidine phosphatase family protein [Flavimarina sp. Hel_I_48]